jgi:hypothetical protein
MLKRKDFFIFFNIFFYLGHYLPLIFVEKKFFEGSKLKVNAVFKKYMEQCKKKSTSSSFFIFYFLNL